MRFRKLHIENFGVFVDRTLELGDQPFQLIYGPNEAGKSTLLQLFREVLFGFPNGSSPYSFESHAGEMAVNAVIDLADDRRVEFRRRKGRKGTVVGVINGTMEKVDDTALSGLLGNANLELYQHVFGFSLSELARGEDSLKHANLNEALFGGGLGSLSNLQQIQQNFDSEAGALFTPTGRNRVINRLLKDIREQSSELKKSILKPRDFDEQQKRLAEAKERVQTLNAEREDIARHRAHLNSLRNAIAPWLELKAAREELAGLEIPESVTPSTGKQFELLQSDFQRAREAQKKEQNQLAELELELTGLKLEPELLQHEGAIRALDKDANRVQRDSEQIPELLSESRSLANQTDRLLKQLAPDWDAEFLECFQAGLEREDRLERLAEERTEIDRCRGELAARRPDLTKRVADAEKRLESLQAVDVDVSLETLVENEGNYRSWLVTRNDLQEALASQQSETVQLANGLTSILPEASLSNEELAEIPVPLESALKDFAERFRRLEESVQEADRELISVKRQLSTRENDLISEIAQGQVPDLAELESARQRRDKTWRLLRHQFMNEEPDSELTGLREDELRRRLEELLQEIDLSSDDTFQALPGTYEELVTTADQLADQRQQHAKLVAVRDRLTLEIDQLSRAVDDAEALMRHRQTVLDQLNEEWRGLWSKCGFTPQAPQVMLEWRGLLIQWRQTRLAAEQTQTRIESLEAKIEDFEKRLAKSLDSDNRSVGDSSPDSLVKIAKGRVDRARSDAEDRQRLTGAIPEMKKELTALDAELDHVDSQQQEWNHNWSSLLSELQFPESISVTAATKMMRSLRQARDSHIRSLELADRAASLNADVDAFNAEVQRLCKEITPELVELPPSDALTRLTERLAAATQAAQEQTSLKNRLAKCRLQIDARETDVRVLSEQVEDLMKSANVSSAEEFMELARQAVHRAELNSETERLLRELKRLAGTEEYDAFEEKLRQTSPESLQLQLEDADRKYAEVDAQRDEALRNDTEAEQQVRSMDGESQAAALQMELENSYAKLGSAVDQLAPVLIAQALLRRAVERFEKEHQPAMLGEVERLFSKMTNGRYTGIRRRLDEQGTMQVEQHNGKLKTPDQLSTGTREQLYLAIRLAYVQQYCQDSEPLPLIMDDILVNFDQQRAESTLDVLIELAGEVQVLFLTCHEHIAALVASKRPDLKSIELQTV